MVGVNEIEEDKQEKYLNKTEHVEGFFVVIFILYMNPCFMQAKISCPKSMSFDLILNERSEHRKGLPQRSEGMEILLWCGT